MPPCPLKNNPHINEIYVYDKDHYRSLPRFQRIAYLWKLHSTIHRNKFDVLFDLSNTNEYGFFAKFFWKVPYRFGFQYKKRGLFLTQKIKIKNGFEKKHVASHYSDLLRFLNLDPGVIHKKLDFFLDPGEKYHVTEQDLKICFLPGGGASWGPNAQNRYWPMSSYAKLGDTLSKTFHAKIFLIGSLSEKNLCDQIQSEMKSPCINLAGQTSLQELAYLMHASQLVIGSESGPLHLVTALKTPSIAIYGPVDEKTYGPYSAQKTHCVAYQEDLACRPCYRNFRMPKCENRLCLTELSVDHVLKIATHLLNNKN